MTEHINTFYRLSSCEPRISHTVQVHKSRVENLHEVVCQIKSVVDPIMHLQNDNSIKCEKQSHQLTHIGSIVKGRSGHSSLLTIIGKLDLYSSQAQNRLGWLYERGLDHPSLNLIFLNHAQGVIVLASCDSFFDQTHPNYDMCAFPYNY